MEKPKNTNLTGKTKDIINAIRSESSSEYKKIVPPINSTNVLELREVGEYITKYESTTNEFLNALVNRIALVLVRSKMYSNPWGMFKKGILEFGDTIEEVFVNIAKAHNYNPQLAETELYKREIPNVKSQFHTLNYKKFYKVTIENEELRTAFLSWNGVEDLISRITESLYTSANYDEYVVMKYMLQRAILDGRMATAYINDVTDSSEVVKKIKSISDSLTFMSDKYNEAGVKTYTLKENQYLFVTSEFNAQMNVDVLATAFNMDKAEFMGHIVLIDNFDESDTERLSTLFGNNYEEIGESDLEKLSLVPAVLVDVDYMLIYDNLLKFTENYNGQGLYWNYFLHTWKMFSTSAFSNAIVFSGIESKITKINLSPSEATLGIGESITITPTFETTGFPRLDIVWSSTNEFVTVNEKGVVTVLEGAQTGDTALILATPVYGGAQAGATITIK